ncbi:MAG TPA: hypothetical protein VFY06_08105 [Verrucomicrobiae bacterium]|nr:hypothetical protein [Verrucomicrobiae bacterium]
MKTILTFTTALLLCCGAQSVTAQVHDEALANQIIAARKANAALLEQYSWSSRTELLDTGTVKDIRIETVAYGPNGQVQRTLVNDEPAPLPHGFLRKRIAEKEREKVEKYLTGLRKLLDDYTLPSAGKVIDFISGATLSAPDANGLLKISGSGVVSPGDTLTLWVDAKTHRASKLQIVTYFDQDEVQVNASFKTLKNGPTHMQFAEVTVPAKGLTLQVHNFDYNANN